MSHALGAEVLANLDKVRRKVAEYARTDPAVFAKFVLRDEKTNAPIDLAPMHVEWQDLLTRHDRVLLWAAIEQGKSQQISVARVLWEIGRNPNLRVVVVSATEGGAKKVVASVARYIMHSAELAMVFPHLRPSDRHGEAWTETRITVARSVQAKDPTILGVGQRGHIHGSRVDLFVFDDLNDYANTATEEQRDEAFQWVTSQAMNRLSDGGRAWFLGNVWHRRDVMHRLEGTPGYVARRYPAHDKRTGRFAWPERYGEAWLTKKRADLVTPSNVDRMVYCELGKDEAQRVQWAWVQRALDLGRGRRLAHALNMTPVGYSLYTGVDLAVQVKKDSDRTAMTTIAVDSVKRRHLLWCESGHWSGPQIIDRLYDHQRRYRPIFAIENNAAQDYILQFARVDRRGPLALVPYTTGKQVANPQFGVEALAVEMAGGHWVIPNQGGGAYDDPEVGALLSELHAYSPTAHAGDRLMSLFFARELAQRGWSPVSSGVIDTTSR